MPEKEEGSLILNVDTLHSPFAEAYRALRANVSFSSVDERVRSVAVTSAAAGEGNHPASVSCRGNLIGDVGQDLLEAIGGRRPHFDQGIAGIAAVVADRDLLDAEGAAGGGDEVENFGEQQAIDDMAADFDLFDMTIGGSG